MYCFAVLFFARLDFVAAQVFLGLNKEHVLAQFRAVFFEGQFLGRVLRVLGRVINTFARLFAYQAYNFAFFAFFRHNATNFNR